MSNVRSLRHRDAPAFGVLVTLHSPDLVELYGRLGFDWLLLDAEHAPLDPWTCRELTRAADLAGLPCVVRVPEIQASVIEGFLDIGVSGILASGVESASDVHKLIAASNELTMVAALIESRRGIEQLDSILTIGELDCVALGPNDLALSLGVTGGATDPLVLDLVGRAEDAIQAAGKRQLTVVADAEKARRAAARGARLIAVPDAILIANAGKDFLARTRDAVSP